MNFTPGQRVIIRDAEWVIRRADILADDGYELVFLTFLKVKKQSF